MNKGLWSQLSHFKNTETRHINQNTNLQCVKLHVGIPVSQPLDHSGNGFFRTTSSKMAISKGTGKSSISWYSTYPDSSVPTLSQTSYIGTAGQSHSPLKRNGSISHHATHHNIFPILGGQILVCRLSYIQASQRPNQNGSATCDPAHYSISHIYEASSES